MNKSLNRKITASFLKLVLLFTFFFILATTVLGATFNADLHPGMDHPEVLPLQQFLNQNGYPVALSGDGSRGLETTIMGRATVAALKRYQQAQGISQTGIVGEKTRVALNRAVASNPAPVVNTPKPAVTTPVNTPLTVTTQNTLFTVDLHPGQEHPQIKALQQYLNRNGYTVANTGDGSIGMETTIMGPATVAALKRFQEAKGINQTGIVGELTRAALNRTTTTYTPPLTNNTPTSLFTVDLHPGQEHPQIKALQQYLNRNGYTVANTGDGSIGMETTIMGPATVAALKSFQASKGINQTGIVGPLTRIALNTNSQTTTTTYNPTNPTNPTFALPNISFLAKPATVKPRKTTKLTWSAPTATNCITTWGSTKNAGTFTTPRLATTTTYSISCSGLGGTSIASLTIPVKKSSGGGGGGGSSNSSGTAGACGSSNNQTFTSAPSTDLCTAGTASLVSGSGPFTWSCVGTGGGASASCSANLTSSSSATALSLTGPTSGLVNAASTNFTVGANGTISGTVTVTPAVTGGGTFSPTTINLTSSSPTRTFTYTPASAGNKSISITNNGSLTNPANISYTANSGAATALTLTGPTGGSTGVASNNFVVAANGTIASTITVTPSASNGNFTPNSVQLTPVISSATFTYTPTSAGTKSISITNNQGLTNPSSRSFIASDPVAGGTWQQLTVASHLRKLLTIQGNGTVQDFTPTKALAVEAQSTQSVSAIPAKAFAMPIYGERDTVYYVGGLHSNYQGNEIDRMTMPSGNEGTVITTTLSHQPNMPPEGKFSGYASGNGGYIYRQYDGGLGDNSDWQPYPGHQWTKNSWNPYWGFISLTAHALQSSYPNGSYLTASGTLLSSAAQPTDGYGDQEENYGVVGFDWETGKYKTYLTTSGVGFPDSLLGSSGVSDWNYWDQSMLFFENNAGITYIKKWNPITGLTTVPYTTLIGGFAGASGNGFLVRILEHRKYLILRQDGNGTWNERSKLLVYSEDFGSGDDRFVELTTPSAYTGDIANGVDGLSFTVDRNSRRVFWLVFPEPGVPIRFYVSNFDDLMNWQPIDFDSDLSIPVGPYTDAWIAANRQPFYFQDGYLYLLLGEPGPSDPGYLNQALSWYRVKVDNGEDLPAMNFERFDYREQNFRFTAADYLQLSSVKHANWAKRTTTGEHWLNAGDLGGSFNSSMAKLEFNGTSRGYTFTETLSETEPAPLHPVTGIRQKRPVSPDDGFWTYLGPTNSSSTLRDKFLYVRGGDGVGFPSNLFTRAAYAQYATNPSVWNSGANDAGAQAAMEADGWTMDRILIFNPETNGFAETRPDLWPMDDGGIGLPHPATLSNSSARNGAYDETTNTLYRITNYYGSLMLAAYDIDDRTVKVWNTAVWTDTNGIMGPAGRTWYTDGQTPTTQTIESNGFGFFDPDNGRWHTSIPGNWEHKALWLDQTDGKLYGVSPQTGYLWAFETRGAEIDLGANGITIPFYPVGNRMPLTGVYPPVDALNGYPAIRWDLPGSLQNASVAMSQFLVPFKGGLLWWGSVSLDSGSFGYPRFAFWRRLGYSGDWTVVTMPKELAANSFSIESLSINNDEVILLNGGGNTIDTQGPWPFFWKLE